mgnify:CR=1 FL=1
MTNQESDGTSGQLLAGVAKVVITDEEWEPSNDPLYAKALVLQAGETTIVIATVDAVAIEEIGAITATFLPALRAKLKQEIGLDPGSLIVNCSHCHGVPCADVLERTAEAVKQAAPQASVMAVGMIFFFVNIAWSLFAGKKAADNPWGEGATTLEWTLSSPPPFHQFETLPVIEDHHTAHDHMSKPQPA